MENASKAIIISGIILLTIASLSLTVYIFSLIANSTSNIYDEMEKSSITEFNQKFLNYDMKDNLKIQDVVSIVNLAKHSNKEKKMPVEVVVKVDGVEWQKEDQEVDLNKKMEEGKENTFTCNITSYRNKLVEKIEITKNNE